MPRESKTFYNECRKFFLLLIIFKDKIQNLLTIGAANANIDIQMAPRELSLSDTKPAKIPPETRKLKLLIFKSQFISRMVPIQFYLHVYLIQ